MAASETNRRIHFRSAANGSNILTVPFDGSHVHIEIAHLAAHCRGNVGTALWFWRERLRSDLDADTLDSDDREKVEQSDEPGVEYVWLAPALPEPMISFEMDEDSVLILHALMLHGGLHASLLSELLPLPHSLCMARLVRLQNAGFVKNWENRLCISERAYFSVRALLHERAYLVDDF